MSSHAYLPVHMRWTVQTGTSVVSSTGLLQKRLGIDNAKNMQMLSRSVELQ